MKNEKNMNEENSDVEVVRFFFYIVLGPTAVIITKTISTTA